MKMSLRFAAIFGAAVLVSGCASSPPLPDDSETTSSPTPNVMTRAEALDAYAASEEAAMESTYANGLYFGSYRAVSIHPRITDETETSTMLPAGSFAQISFTYYYPDGLAWGPIEQQLEANRQSLDDLCHSRLFPAMQAAGVTGSLSAFYVYRLDTLEGDWPWESWSHMCYLEVVS